MNQHVGYGWIFRRGLSKNGLVHVFDPDARKSVCGALSIVHSVFVDCPTKKRPLCAKCQSFGDRHNLFITFGREILPCPRCKCREIGFFDMGYNSFNVGGDHCRVGGGRCQACSFEVIDYVEETTTLAKRVFVWNKGVREFLNSPQSKLKKERQKVRRLRRQIRDTGQDPCV